MSESERVNGRAILSFFFFPLYRERIDVRRLLMLPLRNVVEQVIRLDGSSFKSKPYRFRVQNGGYVVLETEWSSFINPWTKKLEFIIGQHRVLKGPLDPDIFRVPYKTESGYLANVSEKVLKEVKIIQREIQALLNEVKRQRQRDTSRAIIADPSRLGERPLVKYPPHPLRSSEKKKRSL